MIVHRDLPKLDSSVLTIGSFDGMHLGHQHLIKQTIEYSKKFQTNSIVVTFEPHPRLVLQSNEDFQLLNTMEEKLEKLERAGINEVILIPFNQHFSQMNAIDFIESWILKPLNPLAVVLGYDHKFGKNRQGSKATFNELKNSGSYHYQLIEVDEYTSEQIKYSSTEIRNALKLGDIVNANKRLGYDYHLNGSIIHGKQLGRKLGYPTANIKLNHPRKLVPKTGVYHTIIEINQALHLAATSIGYSPTIEDGLDLSIEAYILDFEDNIYGKDVRLSFVDKIRDEMKFDTLEDLKLEIARDIQAIRSSI